MNDFFEFVGQHGAVLGWGTGVVLVAAIVLWAWPRGPRGRHR